MRLQNQFDPLGPSVRLYEAHDGSALHYIDSGEAQECIPVVFFGGAGSSVRAFRLLEFARSLRQSLGVRVVSVERNGLGQTSFSPKVGPVEYAQYVWEIVDFLGFEEVSLVSISGGGPYAAHVANAAGGRVRSLHLACSVAEHLTIPGTDTLIDVDHRVEEIVSDPSSLWRYPLDSPVHQIPGFYDSAIEESVRSVHARGWGAAREGLRQAFAVYRNESLPNLSSMTAPTFGYWGDNDETVPLRHLNRWREVVGGPVVVRIYPGEAHDVQYRHWDQILVDIATLGKKRVVCVGGQTTLVAESAAEDSGVSREASLGMAAWF